MALENEAEVGLKARLVSYKEDWNSAPSSRPENRKKCYESIARNEHRFAVPLPHVKEPNRDTA